VFRAHLIIVLYSEPPQQAGGEKRFHYIYQDTNDVFEREPYIANFKSNNFDFTLVGIHNKPDNAKQEIADLDTVVSNTLAANPNEKDIIILGDFNADGSYFNEKDSTNPFKSLKYSWVISNDMDTMVKTDWTYDRIVMTDSTLKSEYIPNSASVFYYDQKYNLADKNFVADILDHYPVYAEFRTDLGDDD
jgi:deoxyribonuclease-1-like protein